MTTSARSINFQRTRLPSSVFRLSPTLRLFLLMERKYVLIPPINGGPHCRLSSPNSGGSILLTSAPMSARSIVHTGTDRILEGSTTKRSSSGIMTHPHALRAYQLQDT